MTKTTKKNELKLLIIFNVYFKITAAIFYIFSYSNWVTLGTSRFQEMFLEKQNKDFFPSSAIAQ